MNKTLTQAKKITLCGVMVALALALSYIERFIPLQMVVPLPGVKLGLANTVTLVALYMMKRHQHWYQKASGLKMEWYFHWYRMSN